MMSFGIDSVMTLDPGWPAVHTQQAGDFANPVSHIFDDDEISVDLGCKHDYSV